MSREALIEATQALLAEYGYESTSPKDIQRVSGAGQGSFYHHFGSKKELAIVAMERTARELATPSQSPKGAWANVKHYLSKKRNALAGCRLGRHAQEYSVVNDPELRAPVADYFKATFSELCSDIEAAKESGAIVSSAKTQSLAYLLLAAVQGSYTLARVYGRPAPMNEALKALLDLLQDSNK